MQGGNFGLETRTWKRKKSSRIANGSKMEPLHLGQLTRNIRASERHEDKSYKVILF